jgi:hypothetical protein
MRDATECFFDERLGVGIRAVLGKNAHCYAFNDSEVPYRFMLKSHIFSK